MPSTPFYSWTEVVAWTAASSLYINQSWDYNPDLFCMKIARDLARAISKQTALTVFLPPDFSDSNLAVGSPSRHFGRLSSSTALMREFGLVL
jgi:hypothetical protein